MKIVRIILFLFVLSFFVPVAFAFRDITYDIKAEFSPQNKTLTARQIIHFKNTSGKELKKIYLRVYPNHKYSSKEKAQLYKYAGYFKTNPYPAGFDPGSFKINSIKISEEDLKVLRYTFEGEDKTVMCVELESPLQDGQSLNMEMMFSLKIPHRIGRYGWHENTFALNRWYPILCVLDSSGTHKDRDYLLHMPYMSDSAYYRLTLDLPLDYLVALGCDVVEEKIVSGRKIITSFSSEPLRELSLAISKDYIVHESQYGNIKIKSFFFKKDKEYGQKAVEFAGDLIKYYTKQFGEYPYRQFSIASLYLGYGGSQNAGLIFLDSRAYQMPKFLMRYFDFLVAHETGHQWWYNMVGNDESNELWLDEGINSYWISRYLEDKYGKDAQILDMPRWMEYFIPNPTFQATRTYRYIYFAKKGFGQPIIYRASGFGEPSFVFSSAYGKGSAVLEMLEAYVGQEQFSNIVRTYFKSYLYSNASVDDFIKICQGISGKDLKWFFDQWLFGSSLCDYGIKRHKDRLIIEKNADIVMPVETKLEFSDGTQKVVSSDGKSRKEVIELPPDKKLKSASVDQERKTLDIDRVNNHFPRKIDFKLVPLYHGLYDIGVFLKDDAYSWTTGPSLSRYGMGVRSSFQKPDDYIFYAATHYDFNSDSLNSSVGFQKNNFLRKYMSWGVEFFNRHSSQDDEKNLKSYKLYLRHELAVPYSLFDINSHVSLYMLHNISFGKGGFIGSREDARSLNYRQNQETIFGVTYYLANAGPLPDPVSGYQLNAIEEVAGHVLSGGDDFTRTTVEFDKYIELIKGHKLAFRLKAGGGHPSDKYLFYLGSDTGLRGYSFKEIKGSSMLLGSVEYRFPLVNNIDIRFPYNVFSLDQIQGVLFFDTGSAWFNHFNEPGFKKDAGLGFRFYFNIAGSAERLALRLDIASPLSGEDKDIHAWVGINQAF